MVDISEEKAFDTVRSPSIPDKPSVVQAKQDPHDDAYIPIDAHAERKLVRKLDLYIIPVVMLLYLLSFLDRVNIGNARLYHLEEDLSITSQQFNTAVSVLFATYIASELPSNLVLKAFRPSRWISSITVAWGVIAMAMGFVNSYPSLIALRLLLGAVEGGLFPGLAIYLTLFYTKKELALRIGYLFVSAALAGACGGLLAFAIGGMDGTEGMSGWRWIFIIEGLPTIVLGIAVWWLLADDPQTAFYLNAEEKRLMDRRRAQQEGHTRSAEEFHWADVRKGLKDWKVWAFCIALFGCDTMLYGYSTFLPTIIAALNPSWSNSLVQVLTIPCYALGAVTYLVVAWLSDRQQRRGLYTCIFGLVSVVGYALLLSPQSAGVHYTGCFLVAMGLYVVVGLPLAWLPANCPRYGKRTTATGLQLSIGNCAGILASFLYPKNQGPRYIRGHAVTLAMVLWGVLVYACLWFYFARENQKRISGEADARIADMSTEEVAELGDESPKFLYTT
ncbi:MFS general substrate transporter [Eremomyces bilateralis CBS 781.70]|uniref:MFS general substrate transporter n=1 Tax=Eremomyces bilateralis CBS 781.70 TaxID=1392243 RepID=A0A6G1FQL9_9PEZI|nr:MFS general substrate transporter [Eremomyces bilateralis CBS 781.70]KAF1807991.1 MFS general substrate transporter [Eremomyces bilateralis CBS 781.70]